MVIKLGCSQAWMLVRVASQSLCPQLNQATGFPIYDLARYTNQSFVLSGLYKNWLKLRGHSKVKLTAQVEVYVEAGASYALEVMPFEILLWHELVGHATLRKDHPKKAWNSYQHAKDIIKPAGWGRVDPTIEIENQARGELGLKKKRPQ